jgi:hypothetical protein
MARLGKRDLHRILIHQVHRLSFKLANGCGCGDPPQNRDGILA